MLLTKKDKFMVIKPFMFLCFCIFIQSCKSPPRYIITQPSCEYLVGYKEDGSAKFSLRSPQKHTWSIFHALLDKDKTCRSSGDILDFRGNGGGGVTGAIFGVNVSDSFSSIVSTFPAEPSQKKIRDNKQSMAEMVEKIVKQCDDLTTCQAFTDWHNARLAWLIDRNETVYQFRGYDERHRIVKVKGLVCSRLEYNERQKNEVFYDGEVTQRRYNYRRWDRITSQEYISETVCPVVFDGKVNVLRLNLVQAEYTVSSDEKRDKHIATLEEWLQPSIDSIKFLGSISQKLTVVE